MYNLSTINEYKLHNKNTPIENLLYYTEESIYITESVTIVFVIIAILSAILAIIAFIIKKMFDEDIGGSGGGGSSSSSGGQQGGGQQTGGQQGGGQQTGGQQGGGQQGGGQQGGGQQGGGQQGGGQQTGGQQTGGQQGGGQQGGGQQTGGQQTGGQQGGGQQTGGQQGGGQQGGSQQGGGQQTNQSNAKTQKPQIPTDINGKIAYYKSQNNRDLDYYWDDNMNKAVNIFLNCNLDVKPLNALTKRSVRLYHALDELLGKAIDTVSKGLNLTSKTLVSFTTTTHRQDVTSATNANPVDQDTGSQQDFRVSKTDLKDYQDTTKEILDNYKKIFDKSINQSSEIKTDAELSKAHKDIYELDMYKLLKQKHSEITNIKNFIDKYMKDDFDFYATTGQTTIKNDKPTKNSQGVYNDEDKIKYPNNANNNTNTNGQQNNNNNGPDSYIEWSEIEVQMDYIRLNVDLIKNMYNCISAKLVGVSSFMNLVYGQTIFGKNVGAVKNKAKPYAKRIW